MIGSGAEIADSNASTRVRRPGGSRSGAAGTGAVGRNAGNRSSVAPQSSADLSLIQTLLTPGGVQNLLQESVTSLIGSLFTAAPGADAVTETAPAPQIIAAPQVPDVAAAPEPPVMTAAAPAGAVAEAEGDPSALLGGEGGGVPVAAPLAWAALAAARREDLAGVTPEVAPAAAVGTAETVDPIVGAARTITISNVTPNSGQLGTTITITGAAFNPTLGAKVDAVYFGCSGASATCADGIKTTPTNVSNTQITVAVPQGATTGFIQVYAPTTNNFGRPDPSWSNYSQTFTVEAPVPAPTVAGLSADSGVVGESVTITGTNFNQNATVKFGCTTTTNCKSAKDATSVTYVDPQTIQAAIPQGAPSGYLQVATASGTAYSPNSFKVNTPSITSLDPAKGAIGSPLTINGSFLSGTSLVTFAGGADGKGVSVEPDGFTVVNGDGQQSQIQVTAIPVGAQTGQIQVTTPNGVLKTPAWTNSAQPAIASITPNKGNSGSQVTITGTNFTNANGDPIVQSVQFTSLGAPEIVAGIPALRS